MLASPNSLIKYQRHFLGGRLADLKGHWGDETSKNRQGTPEREEGPRH